MKQIINDFLDRNLPRFKDRVKVTITPDNIDKYTLEYVSGDLVINASSFIAFCVGLYDYLREHCNVQLTWCSNTTINISDFVPIDYVMSRTIKQRFRTYMNYCTLNYTMSWWNFDRWEKEIDFMAMNGINMPLAVVGSEAVWYETMIELGLTEEESLSTVSGPAFWAWHLMTNIESYLPPQNKKYIDERLELGRRILARYLEFGMQPIQQGFSGFVPMLLKEKNPDKNIYEQKGWCKYPKTAQLDPTDEYFATVGTVYLRKMKELFGAYHYYACDPFHEGTPPREDKEYLQSVGKSINRLYESFDNESVWVMQGWTPRREIVEAVPIGRLLILDLDSDRTAKEYAWVHKSGHPLICGMLHNFGGKNAMQGHLAEHCRDRFGELADKGINVIGSGMFMEGIEQNPVIYDLQFQMLTASGRVNLDDWIKNYIRRRYGAYNGALYYTWKKLIDTCYRSDGYEENRVGSCLCARPQLMPTMTGPCCFTKVYYDTKEYEKAVLLFATLTDELAGNDAYEYDLCDMVRQALSNRFYDNQLAIAKECRRLIRSKSKVCELIDTQLQLLEDLDNLLGHREEFTLARWVNMAHNLATDEEERAYFDKQARCLITLWGDINGDTTDLFDYAWREWNGLISEYYLPRWTMYYDYVLNCLDSHKRIKMEQVRNGWVQRRKYRSTELGKEMDKFEHDWVNTYSEYDAPHTDSVIAPAKEMIEKYNLGR